MRSYRNVWTVIALVAGSLLCTHPSLAQKGDATLISRDAKGDIRIRDDAAGFGTKGQWAFSTDAALEIRRRTQSGSPSSTTLSILPAADYFIIENLSLGGVIGVRYGKTGDNRTTDFQLGPRVGYNFEFSQLLSIWPKVGLLYSYGKFKRTFAQADGTEVSQTDDNSAIQLNLFVPVVFHPAPHFFAGFGPFLETALNGDNRATEWGLKLTLGGWIQARGPRRAERAGRLARITA